MSRKIIDLRGVGQEAASHREETRPVPSSPAEAQKTRRAFPKPVRVSLHLPAEAIRALKRLAAERGQSPSQVVAQLLEVSHD